MHTIQPSASKPKSPWLKLALFYTCLATSFLTLSGLCGRMETQIEIDTKSYLEAPTSSLKLMLQDFRTPGYPLFLDLMESLGSLDWVPWIHGAIWLAAVGCLLATMSLWGIDRYSLLAVAIALGNHPFLHFWSRVVISDTLAMSTALMSIAAMMEALRRRQSGWTGAWLWTLACLTFTTILIRPAFLFLLVLWPLGMAWWRWTNDREPLRRAIGDAGKLAVLCWSPLLVYSLMRWMVVGHFGLVSFGGYNVIGIAGQFMEEKDLPHFPAELQATAKEILVQRDRHPMFLRNDDDRFSQMMERYNPMIWEVTFPIYEKKQLSRLTSNQQLTTLSRTLIRRHWRDYLWWLAYNARHGIRGTAMQVGGSPGLRLLLTLGIVLIAWRSLPTAIPNRFRPEKAFSGSVHQPSLTGLRLLFWISLGMLLGNVMLVILVEPTIERYMAVSSVLPCAWLAVAIQRFLSDIAPHRTALTPTQSSITPP
jgi:hypothetical protein